MFKKVDEIINLDKRRGAINAARIVSLAQKVVGPEAQVISYRAGVLKLRVESSVWADKINMQKDRLILEINEKLHGGARIEKIKFEL